VKIIVIFFRVPLVVLTIQTDDPILKGATYNTTNFIQFNRSVWMWQAVDNVQPVQDSIYKET